MLHSHAWYQERQMWFIAGDPAVKIDRTRKQVTTQQGQIVDYDRLILATGSKPFIPPIQGINSKASSAFGISMMSTPWWITHLAKLTPL